MWNIILCHVLLYGSGCGVTDGRLNAFWFFLSIFLTILYFHIKIGLYRLLLWDILMPDYLVSIYCPKNFIMGVCWYWYNRVGHPSCLPALQLGLQGLQFGLQGLQFAVRESLNITSLFFQSKYFRSPRLTICSQRLTVCLQWVKKLTNCKPKAYNAQPWYKQIMVSFCLYIFHLSFKHMTSDHE